MRRVKIKPCKVKKGQNVRYKGRLYKSGEPFPLGFEWMVPLHLHDGGRFVQNVAEFRVEVL